MFSHLRQNIRDTAQRFALGSVGALMTLVGLGFLSASALMLLLTVTDPMTASAIMGGAFLGIGLLMMAAARSSKPDHNRHHRREVHPKTEEMPPLAAAFMQGMVQGMAHRR
ncbi:phage holin family protein [uncultured Roseobacter sp.]|uniref:phage holin family protein n=1 Tax=uncultured Roseobacter sp. TaxID=114847 RepID=UPI00261B572A|nr:phage holin family protein [uncultured Roseobacter sp.]